MFYIGGKITKKNRMEKAELKIDYTVYRESYPEGYEELCRAALDVTKNAYCVYSGFAVGAAVLMNNGEVVCGTNQENVAYPSGLCAERVAIFYAHARYPDSNIESIAVTASVDGHLCEDPTYPCGACRQVMAESENRSGKPIKIIIGGERITQVMDSVSSLLPFSFDNLPER